MKKIHTFLLLCIAFSLFQCKNDTKPAASDVAPITVDTLTGAPIRGGNDWVNHAGDLITDAELKTIFGEYGIDRINRATLPDKAYCMMTWMKPDWKDRESANQLPENEKNQVEFKNTVVLDVINYGTEVMADQQLEALKPANNPDYEQEVIGVGKTAVWSSKNRILAVQKGHLMVQIMVNSTDQVIDDLPRAQRSL